MDQPGLRLVLDQRHRDKDGQIGRKYGSTLIGTLRQTLAQSSPPDLMRTQSLPMSS